MTALIQPQHDLSANEIDAIEDHIYDYNRRATGPYSGQRLAVENPEEAGRASGESAGYACVVLS